MPVSFTAIGTKIDASIVDGNFDECVRLLREQIKNADINDESIDRWIVRQYTAGRIAKANVKAGIVTFSRKNIIESQAIPDGLLRDPLYARAGLGPSLKSSIYGATFEMLGRPGPSFYWTFQEQGGSYGGTLPTVNRFPAEYCYSEWLTVPGASIKVYVPHPCKVTARGQFWMQCLSSFFEQGGAHDIAVNGKTDYMPLRFALVVDTNPNLFDDEFANTNPNVKIPGSSTMAPYVSWNIFEQETLYCPQWAKDEIEGDVHLKGGRWYNFSMKFHHASTRGYDSAGTLQDALYEEAVALPNFNGTRRQAAHKYPADINWFSSSLDLDFTYGYSQHHQDSDNVNSTP